MEGEPRACGFYGKLISAGDFIRRGFPADLYDQWDPWLQRGLVASRAQLGEHWLHAYLSAPIWRFALASGVAGERTWVGAMMPSVDRVGRYFPLTVAAEASTAAGVFRVARAAEPWLQLVETELLETLEGDGIAADVLAERIAATSCALDECAANPSRVAIGGDDESDDYLAIQAATVPGSELLTSAYADLLARRQFGESLSLWWSAGSDRVVAGARLHSDLPADSDFYRLLADEIPANSASTE